ncbi:MAG: 16S rRNA (cytidine(1402)-2'-O)-methyltransferase [Parcubacteria group bacterium]|jgi:16S rRNA (cytidine1402-2'-O)-methyltransferase
MSRGILYIVATPIGNLGDITLRALETLKSVDYVACEDTRVTSKLLNHYSIQKTLISYHQHSELKKIDLIINKLKEGKNIALVTDAGTPGISDPGNILVAEAVKNNIEIHPIPGASALASMISIAGIDLQKFLFLGFPPHKKGRETFFKEVISLKYPVIYYESPHRFIKNLELLKLLECQKRIIIGRELTKIFEEIKRGNTDEILSYYQENGDKIKGEFVVIVY